MTKRFLIRNHLVAIREMMKGVPEVLAVRVDDEGLTVLLNRPEDVRSWADEAGVAVENGDKWDEVSAVVDGVTVHAFGEW